VLRGIDGVLCRHMSVLLSLRLCDQLCGLSYCLYSGSSGLRYQLYGVTPFVRSQPSKQFTVWLGMRNLPVELHLLHTGCLPNIKVGVRDKLVVVRMPRSRRPPSLSILRGRVACILVFAIPPAHVRRVSGPQVSPAWSRVLAYKHRLVRAFRRCAAW
jgi:hypothetical protein